MPSAVFWSSTAQSIPSVVLSVLFEEKDTYGLSETLALKI